MGFIGTNPVGVVGVPTDTYASTDSKQPHLGNAAFYVNSSGYWSVLKFVEIVDGCSKGDVLVKDNDQNPPYNLVTSATADGGMPVFRGIAAATIASGKRGWAYCGGYCPDANMPTAFASGVVLRISATYAGRLSSAVVNDSAACTATLLIHPVALSLDANTVSTANSTGSIMIYGMYL